MKENIFFAVKNLNSEDRIISSSGGVFLAVAKKILLENGAVYGAIYDSNFNVVHTRADNFEDLKKMTGSKYSQSDITQCIELIKKDLADGKNVLFSGTPCEVHYLNAVIKDNKSKLITIDLVCHGTPEKKFLKDYIDYEEKRNKSKIIKINMRYKDNKEFKNNLKKKHYPIGIIEPHFMKIDFNNGKSIKERSDFNVYYLLFDYFIKAGCFKCPFANINRVGDITIGDFHEFNCKLKEFNDGNGVSLVIINTEKGQRLFESIKNEFSIIRKEKQECLQPALINPTKKPIGYDKFREEYNDNGYKYVFKNYVKKGIKNKIKLILYKIKILDFIMRIKNKNN